MQCKLHNDNNENKKKLMIKTSTNMNEINILIIPSTLNNIMFVLILTLFSLHLNMLFSLIE